jgi:enoyl-CoA hydratase/carnithine racemase
VSRYDEYRDRYRNIAFERRGAAVQLRLHTDGGVLQWGSDEGCVHGQLTEAFHAVAGDPDVRAVILTGTGEEFCTQLHPGENSREPMTATRWARLMREGRDLLQRFLDIEVPVIAAINGPVHIHSELPVLADIVLASSTAEFADRAHFVHGVVPADGVHVVWPLLLGPNRSRHFLLTGRAIGATEALALGVIAEVLPPGSLQARAWELAADLAQKPLAALRNTRLALTRRIRRELEADLDIGLALEGLGLVSLFETK